MVRVLLLALFIVLSTALPAEAFGRKKRAQSTPVPCPCPCPCLQTWQPPLDPCHSNQSMQIIDGVLVVGKIPSFPPIEE